MTRQDFIIKYYFTAQDTTKGTGIFPLVMLAQAILESSKLINGSWLPGESLLSKKYNNYFGIKAGSNWKGATINMSTMEYNSGGNTYYTNADFRAYPTIQDGFKDYINFLQVNPRYKNAGVFTASNEDEQADRLQKAGYATNPNYSNLLKVMMKTLRTYVPKNNTGSSVALVIFGSVLIYGLYKLIN